MKIVAMVVAVLLILVLAVGGFYVSRRNEMVRKNEDVNLAWAQVDTSLQRRADLIPNLVATVQGFAAHEEKVFGDIAAARSALLSAKSPNDRMSANGQLDGAIGRLLAIVENYPQLKSNENFLRLQDELAGTENRIAVERRRYNESVRDYNVYITTFPNSMIAGSAGFARKQSFEASPASREVPKVQFPGAGHSQLHRSLTSAWA
jgi:LemA protein